MQHEGSQGPSQKIGVGHDGMTRRGGKARGITNLPYSGTDFHSFVLISFHRRGINVINDLK